MGSQETEGGEMDEMDTAMELRHPGYRLDDSHALPASRRKDAWGAPLYRDQVGVDPRAA